MTDRGTPAVIMMGVSGSGKTTVAKIVADRLGWRFGEADEMQPALNVAKMRARMPLTDLDRLPWLTAVRDWMRSSDDPVVVSCSALRRSYRDLLHAADLDLSFAQLDGDFDLIWPRLEARPGPIMTATMLESQFAAFEGLQPDEPGAVIMVDADPETVADRVITELGLGST